MIYVCFFFSTTYHVTFCIYWLRCNRRLPALYNDTVFWWNGSLWHASLVFSIDVENRRGKSAFLLQELLSLLFSLVMTRQLLQISHIYRRNLLSLHLDTTTSLLPVAMKTQHSAVTPPKHTEFLSVKMFKSIWHLRLTQYMWLLLLQGQPSTLQL